MKRISKIMMILSILSTISRSFSISTSVDKRRLRPIDYCAATGYLRSPNPPCLNFPNNDICREYNMVECFDDGACPARFSSSAVNTSIGDPYLDPWQFCRLQGRVGLKNFGRRDNSKACIATYWNRLLAEGQCGFGKDFPDSCENYPYCCTIDSIDIQCSVEPLEEARECIIGPLPDYVEINPACEEGARLPIGSQCDYECINGYVGYQLYECVKDSEGNPELVERNRCEEQVVQCQPFKLTEEFIAENDVQNGVSACTFLLSP